MILLYVPCKDESEARGISKELIAKKLIACANIFPIGSLYPWEGRLNDEKECVMLAKTTEEKEDKAREGIAKLHSYTIPAILSFPVRSNREYEDWLKEELG